MQRYLDRMGNNLKDRYEFTKTKISRESVFLGVGLTLIFLIAFIVRIYPYFRYELILRANDPYSQLKAAQFIDTFGLGAFLDWTDKWTWYPWGRPWGSSQYIGTPLTSVITHQALHFIGIEYSITTISFFMPALLGSFSVILIFLLGKELGNNRVGLISAFFLSISQGHIQRTTVGFYDNEGLGIFLLIITILLFMKSLKNGSIIYGLLSGFFLGSLTLSWGASAYAIDLLALYAFVLVISRKFSSRLLIAFASCTSVSLFIAILIPRNGTNFLQTSDAYIPLGVLAILFALQLYEYLKINFPGEKFQFYSRVVGYSAVVVIIIGVPLLVLTNTLSLVGGKFLSVLLPFYRSQTPILKSVSEHLIVTWASLFRNLHVLAILLPLGFIYSYQKPTERNIMVIVFGMTALYFAGSMVRLILILAPAAALVGGKAIDETMTPFALTFQEKFALSKRKARVYTSIGNEHTAIAFMIVGIILMLYMFHSVDLARATSGPAAILTQVPEGNRITEGKDWLEACMWLSQNAGVTDVIASWWDYGYWISVTSNRTILVDNATINTTQIANVGAMLVSTPDISLQIASKYDVSYIVILLSGGYTYAGFDSDLGKVPWFVKISESSSDLADIDQTDYLQYDSTGKFLQGYVDKFYKSLFWALLTEGVTETIYGSVTNYGPVANAPQQGFAPDYVTYADVFQEAYLTFHDWIRIFKINYDNAPPGILG